MMESETFFNKGYGKVENIEDPNALTTESQKRHRVSKLTLSAITLLLTILVGATVAALVYSSSTDSPTESTLLNSVNSIKLVCNVTRYPESCFSSISSLSKSPKPDPITILKLSINVSISELSNVSSFFKTLNSNLGDCGDLFDDAVSRLRESEMGMRGCEKGGLLDERKVNDVQTWLSAALTDQETCLDGLEEIESTALIEVKGKVVKSKEYVSNSLAIVANFNEIIHKFGLTMH